jgi:hypothetical protein
VSAVFRLERPPTEPSDLGKGAVRVKSEVSRQGRYTLGAAVL